MYQKVSRRAELLRLHRHDFGPAEEAAVLEVLRSGWLTRGPRTQQFEQDFASRVDAPYALGLNSCTAALHLALLCGGVGPGDEVIVPALTFAATANTVVHCGATPVFADVLPASQCMDPASVKRLITNRTKAIVPVHYGGMACDMPALQQLAGEHGLFIVEDCAHAVETRLADGRPVGVADGSRFAAYSFYATKNLITAEGGMLCCRDEADLEQARVIGLHGMSRNAWKRYSGEGFMLYDIEAAGFKYNMFDMQAALGLVQLSKLDENHRRRSELAARYAERLAVESRIEIPQAPQDTLHAHHLMAVRLTEEFCAGLALPVFDLRNTVIGGLREEMVESYVHYITLPGTRFYRENFDTSSDDCPRAAGISERVISLPLYPGMLPEDVDYCCGKLTEVLDGLAGETA